MSEKTKKRKKKDNQKRVVTRGIYDNGNIKLLGKGLPKRKMKVIVTFQEETADSKNNKTQQIENFLKKWSGSINTESINVTADKKIQYLIEKHK